VQPVNVPVLVLHCNKYSHANGTGLTIARGARAAGCRDVPGAEREKPQNPKRCVQWRWR
jgi:hypothetical protein